MPTVSYFDSPTLSFLLKSFTRLMKQPKITPSSAFQKLCATASRQWPLPELLHYLPCFLSPLPSPQYVLHYKRWFTPCGCCVWKNSSGFPVYLRVLNIIFNVIHNIVPARFSWVSHLLPGCFLNSQPLAFVFAVYSLHTQFPISEGLILLSS